MRASFGSLSGLRRRLEEFLSDFVSGNDWRVIRPAGVIRRGAINKGGTCLFGEVGTRDVLVASPTSVVVKGFTAPRPP